MEAVARLACRLVGCHHRASDEARKEVEYLIALDPFAAQDGLSGVEREAPREDGEPVECLHVLVGEEFVGPIDRIAQGLVPFERRTTPAGQETKALVEVLRDFAYGK